MGEQDCEITACCKGHLAGMTLETTLILKNRLDFKAIFLTSQAFHHN